MSALFHFAFRVAHAVRKIWWNLAKPEIFGAKAIVLDGKGNVLLIRHSYGASHLYMLPGGGVKKGEDPALAVGREVQEETGCHFHDARWHGRFLDQTMGAKNWVDIYVGTTSDNPVVDGKEILEAQFMPLEALPDNVSRPTRDRIVEVRDNLPPADSW